MEGKGQGILQVWQMYSGVNQSVIPVLIPLTTVESIFAFSQQNVMKNGVELVH
jgi:hypothetical protein